MTAVVDGLRACYLGVAACMGVVNAPVSPHVEIVPNVPHVNLSGVPNSPGFACGEYVDGTTAYCAGLYERGWVVVSTHTMQALPHEFIHYVVERRHLWKSSSGDMADTADNDHAGPWWHCEQKAAVPACVGLWP